MSEPLARIQVATDALKSPAIRERLMTMLGEVRVELGKGEHRDMIDMVLYPNEEIPVPRHPLSERFHAVLEEMGSLHDRKQSDYGRDNDPFANVRATEEWGQPGWVGALIRGTDKLRRLQKVARGGTLANEGARDSFLDLAVYAVIGLVLWEEEQEQKRQERGAA